MKRNWTVGIAIAMAASLAACGGNDNNNDNSQPSAPAPEASSLYSPASQDAVVPFPNNLLFVDANNTSGLLAGVSADGTLNIPDASGANPVIAGANKLDGFSTTDNLYADFSGADIDVATANDGGVRLIDAATGAELAAGTDFDVIKSPDVVDHTRLLIRPLKALEPGTTYYVVITDKLKTTDGGSVAPSDQFSVVDSDSAVGSDGNPATTFNAAQQATLESIRSRQIRPILDSVSGVSASNVIVAWQFTTQSIGGSLRYIAAHPTPNPDSSSDGGIRVQPLPNGQGGQLSTGDINAEPARYREHLSGDGRFSYYLAAAANDGTATPAPLTTYWASNGQAAPGHATLRTPSGGAFPAACSPPAIPRRAVSLIRKSARYSRCRCWWPSPMPTARAAARRPPAAGRS